MTEDLIGALSAGLYMNLSSQSRNREDADKELKKYGCVLFAESEMGTGI